MPFNYGRDDLELIHKIHTEYDVTIAVVSEIPRIRPDRHDLRYTDDGRGAEECRT
jgi:hypothetical protein